MANHTKPTDEELQAKIEASMKDLDKEEATEEVVDDVVEDQEETEDKEVEETKETEEESSEEVEQETDKELKKEVEKENPGEEKEEDEDTSKYKKRYQDSSREAQILYNKNKKMAEAIEKAGEVAEPTTEELQSEYSDWDVMSDFEKKMAKQNLMNSRQLEAIREATKDFKDMDAWNGKVDNFMADAETLVQHPELEGKEEFKLFTSLPTRRGVDFDVLVSSFLYEAGKKVVKKKGSMMPTGSAGADKQKKADGKLSLSESRRLRTVNYKSYLKALKAGKIRSEV